MSAERPLVTLALTCYNHERYVEAAAQGLLSQTYGPAEIILSDDCSSDRSFDIIQSLAAAYRGPHEVRLNRNERNMGTGAHLSKVLAMARGSIFIGSASDDISEPQRAEKLVEVFVKNPRAQCVWSNAQIIDGDGREIRLFADPEFRGNGDEGMRPVTTTVRTPWTLGATAVYRMDVWKFFGPLMEGIAQEDLAMAWRCRLIGDICYVPEVLMKYRQHGANLFSYEQRDVVQSIGKKKAAASKRLQRRQAWQDLCTARRKGAISTRAFWYYALASRQRYMLDDLKRAAAPHGKAAQWGAEQVSRVVRFVDGRITQPVVWREAAKPRSKDKEVGR